MSCRKPTLLLVLSFLLPLLAFTGLGLSIIKDYPVYYDDLYETQMAIDNIRLVTQAYFKGDLEKPDKKIYYNLEYYGTFFNLVAYLFQKNLLPAGKSLKSLASYQIKQHVVFFFSLIAYMALAVALYGYTRSVWAASLAFLTLGTQPSFFEMIFSNPKDPPFAAMFTLFSLLAAYGLQHIFLPDDSKQWEKKASGWVVIIGLVAGLTASIRIAGIMLLALWSMHYAIAAFLEKRWNVGRFLLSSAAIAGITFAVIYVFHPVGYFHPVSWFMNSLWFHAHHPLKVWTLTDGEWIYSLHTKWYYLPKWFFAKTPLIWQIFCVYGLVVSFVNCRSQTRLQNFLCLFFLSQLLLLPLLASIGKIHLYGSQRHFLFVYPAMAFFCSIALYHLGQHSVKIRLLAFLLTCLAVGKLTYEMVTLHPSQSAYFNELMRPTMNDEWQNKGSLVEVLDWMDEQQLKPPLLVYGINRDIRAYGALYSHKIAVRNLSVPIATPHYYLLQGKAMEHDTIYIKNCEPIHTFEKKMGSDQIVLFTLFYCHGNSVMEEEKRARSVVEEP